MNDLLQQVKEIINSDNRFHYIGRAANEGVWETDPDSFITFSKNIARKGYGKARLTIFQQNENGLEIKIQIYIPSYCEWDTFFEGFLETIDDYHTIIKLIGI